MLEQDLVLYLPWPPTVNDYYKVTRHGQRYLSTKVRGFRESVEESLGEQCPGLELDEQLFLEVYLFPPDRRKRDLDNYMKGLLDSVTQAKMWVDDSQVDQLHIYRGEVMSDGVVVVSVSDAGPIIKYEALVKMLG